MHILAHIFHSLTNDDEVYLDLLAAESVGALAGELAVVLLVDVCNLEVLLGCSEPLPGVGTDALPALGPIDHGRGVAGHGAGDAGVRAQTHDLCHLLLTRGGRAWKSEDKDLTLVIADWSYVIVE